MFLCGVGLDRRTRTMPLLLCLRAQIPMSTGVLLMLQLEAEAWIGSWSGEQSNLKTEGAGLQQGGIQEKVVTSAVC